MTPSRATTAVKRLERLRALIANAPQSAWPSASYRCLIKTCGMTRPQDISAINDAQPDFCGFIINFPKSTRNLTPDQTRELTSKLDPGCFAVGVFVDQPQEEIIALAQDHTLDAVQLHGHEGPDYVRQLKTRIGQPIIQAFRIHGATDVKLAHDSPADLVLLDSGTGSGVAFDWSLATLERPFFLAGGLTPKNIGHAIAQMHPFAVDLSSGLETNGCKDASKIGAAVAAVRSFS